MNAVLFLKLLLLCVDSDDTVLYDVDMVCKFDDEDEGCLVYPKLMKYENVRVLDDTTAFGGETKGDEEEENKLRDDWTGLILGDDTSPPPLQSIILSCIESLNKLVTIYLSYYYDIHVVTFTCIITFSDLNRRIQRTSYVQS